MKKVAITLAELMIALSIIAVIAVITVPTLINNHNKATAQAFLRKAFNELNTALKLVEMENNGRIMSCYYWNNQIDRGKCQYNWYGKDDQDESGYWKFECSEGTTPILSDWSECQNKFWPEFLDTIGMVKKCDKGSLDGCIPKYLGLDGKYEAKTSEDKQTVKDRKRSIVGCPGWSNENIEKSQAVILKNGMILFNYDGKWGSPIMAVDVNGLHGPNKWGHDLFVFILRRDNTKIADANEQYGYRYITGNNWRFEPGGCEGSAEFGGALTNTVLYDNAYISK